MAIPDTHKAFAPIGWDIAYFITVLVIGGIVINLVGAGYSLGIR